MANPTYADLIKETTATTGPDVVQLGGAVQPFRTFAQGHQPGDRLFYCIRHATLPEFETGLGTLIDTTHLSRDIIYTSSNGNQIVNFSAGAKDVFEATPAAQMARWAAPDAPYVTTVANVATSSIVLEESGSFNRIKIADFLASIGLSAAQLSAAGALSGTDIVPITQDGSNEVRTTLDAVASYVATKIGSVDTTPPTFLSAQVANASPSVIQITMSEALAATLPPASAFAVSGGKTVSSVAISGAVISLTCNGAYANGDAINVIYTKPSSGAMLTDTAATPNPAASFGPMSVTNNIAAAGATAPGAPTIGTAVAGNGYVDVGFTAPASNGGSAIIDYTVTLSTGQTATGTTSPVRVTAPNGTAVTATVTARNSVGSSVASAPSNSVTPSATVPGAPTIGSVTAGDGQITVAFSAPASNGGAAISLYTVTVYKASDLSIVTTATGSASPIVVSGLTNGVAVYAKVAATNSAGTGSQSASSSTITPAASVALQAYTTTGYGSPANSIKTAIDSTVAGSFSYNDYPPAGRGFTGDKVATNNNSYWYIKKTSDNSIPPKAVSGWSKSNTQAPSIITSAQNIASNNSINGMVPMGFNVGTGNFLDNAVLWVAKGDTTPSYWWTQALDANSVPIGNPVCVNAANGLVVTGYN